MIQDEFIFYKPCKLLQPYVRYYWVFKSDQPLNTFTFPIGCPQIIFHRQSPLYIPELNAIQDKLTISGQVNFSSHLCAEEKIEMIVVVFQPHAMGTFLDVPTSLFYNQEVSGYNLESRGFNELAERIFECEDNSLNVRHIEEWLLLQMIKKTNKKRLGAAKQNLERIDASIKKICAVPQTSVNELSSIACLSKKQFERIFNSLVGINPKEYTRIVRFQKALEQMQQQFGKINQAQIAYECGYADQSHFIREFKRFCGYTPLSLLKISRPYSDLFTNPV